MRSFLVLLLSFIFSIVATSQNNGIFNFEKDMIWIENAKLFVCKYEVTNVEYREFTDELLKDSATLHRDSVYKLYYPDTAVWIRQFYHHMGDPMNTYYRWLPAFNAYPVCGIRYEGAVKYCEWLTRKYGKGKYKFRLPTREEFVNYSKVGSAPFPGGLANPRNSEMNYLLNYKPNKTTLDDSIYIVLYNPSDNTFCRFHKNEDSIRSVCNKKKLKGYTYDIENSSDGYLYLTFYKKFLKAKIQDSITFYDPETDTYKKEKMILNTTSNYYEDGYMYSSPSRAIKDKDEVRAFDPNRTIIAGYNPAIIANKGTYPADKNGLFDLAGNVSELIAEKGISMGGNWGTEIDELKYNMEYKATETNVLDGFRIVAEPLNK